MILTLLIVLTSGCAKITADTYCDIASPHYFGSDATVDWLMRNDKQFLVDNLVHNETFDKLCS